MLAASIAAPIAVPWPMRLCSSSMNRMTSVAAGRLGDERPDALLVLPAVRRAGEQGDVIQREQPNGLEDDRHRLGGDALSQSFGDRRLADAGRPTRVGLFLP
jgi:hypothetical protein